MKPISAIDAIAPAFRRTRLVFTEPFRLGFFLKLIIVATFAEANLITMGILLPMQAANLLFQFLMASQGPNHGSFPLPQIPSGGVGTAFFITIAMGIFIYLLVCVVCFYIFTRFRFMVFEAALIGERKLGRAWTKYGRQTWRYYGLSILIALACMLVATAVASPIILVCLRMLRSGNISNASAAGSVFGFFVVFILIEYALIFVSIVADGLTRDFLLPPIAIEDAAIESSSARFMNLVRDDVAGVFVFTLLRFALRFAFGIVLTIVMLIPLFIIGLVLFGIGALLYHPLWAAGLAGHALFVGYVAVAGLFFFVLYLILVFTATGVMSVFTQCYALIFFADRYPQLGNILNPPPPLIEIPAENVGSSPEPSSGEPPPFLPEPPPVW
jgi:hypothetical protein